MVGDAYRPLNSSSRPPLSFYSKSSLEGMVHQPLAMESTDVELM